MGNLLYFCRNLKGKLGGGVEKGEVWRDFGGRVSR
jgi:hypothetical protein